MNQQSPNFLQRLYQATFVGSQPTPEKSIANNNINAVPQRQGQLNIPADYGMIIEESESEAKHDHSTSTTIPHLLSPHQSIVEFNADDTSPYLHTRARAQHCYAISHRPSSLTSSISSLRSENHSTSSIVGAPLHRSHEQSNLKRFIGLQWYDYLVQLFPYSGSSSHSRRSVNVQLHHSKGKKLMDSTPRRKSAVMSNQYRNGKSGVHKQRKRRKSRRINLSKNSPTVSGNLPASSSAGSRYNLRPRKH